MVKHKYKNYENYTKAANKFSQDKTVKAMKTLCDRINGIFEIEVEKR